MHFFGHQVLILFWTHLPCFFSILSVCMPGLFCSAAFWLVWIAYCGRLGRGAKKKKKNRAIKRFRNRTISNRDFISISINRTALIYIYIYICTHTHTHTHVGFYGLRGLSIGVMVFILYKLYVLLPYTYPTPKLSPHRRRCIYIFPQKNSLCMIYKRFKLWGHWKCPHKSPSPCNTYVIPMSLYKFVSS